MVKQLPLACLLVETDTPVLGPIPNARNEPANLPICIQTLAKIKAIAEEAAIEAVVENTQRVYGNLGVWM